MREGLQILEGKRIEVMGVVDRFGTKKAYQGPPLQTICLVDLTDLAGNPICDHLWLVVRKQIKELDLQEGDKIKFCARSKQYTKGYRGRREDVFVPLSKDYKLSHPTKFEVLKRADDKAQIKLEL